MPNDIIQHTLEAIKTRHITPEPQWRVFLKRRSTWIFFALASLFGAIVFSIASATLSDLDWDIPLSRPHLFGSASFFPFLSFWTALIILCIILAIIGLRKTAYGYRYERTTLIALSFGGIIFLGLFLWRVGAGQHFDTVLMRGVPVYGRHTITKEMQWSQPENGLLAGTVLSVSDTRFSLGDFSGQPWTITINSNTIIRPAVTLRENIIVKIIGHPTGKNTFTAQEIRPWDGAGIMRGRNR